MTKLQEIKQNTILTKAYDDYNFSLITYAILKTRDRALCEDLAQNTFMKTWTYLTEGGKIDLMKAFLYKILNNLIVDEYRKRKTTSLDVLLEKGFKPIAGDAGQLINILDGKAALLLIQRLPIKYQKVVRMRYIQDLSLKEMSLLTGLSKNTVSVQVHRGLAKLKLLYDPNALGGVIRLVQNKFE